MMTAKDVTRLRRRLGETQDEFADRFGVQARTVRRWERGDTRPGTGGGPGAADIRGALEDVENDLRERDERRAFEAGVRAGRQRPNAPTSELFLVWKWQK